jgi:hypothetical protein
VVDALEDSVLQRHGKQGWELVSFCPATGEGSKTLGHFIYVFKRPAE